MAPVVTAALGALGPLLGKLTDLLKNECGRLKGVRREIRSLRSEFNSMHAALKKYATLEEPDDQVKEWISLVRELSYDTEDCFDKFIHHLGNGEHHDSGVKEFFRKTVRRLKTLGARRGIAKQINNLKIRIKEVKELKTSYKLDDMACSTSGHAAPDPRLAAWFTEEEHLVGVDGPREDLSKWTVEEKNKHHRRVLSIVGFGGLGKTTLANVVYRKIQRHFPCHAFVSVSQKPNTDQIIKDVISQVISQVHCKDEFTKDMKNWDIKKSITKLRELLQDRRYLIIIDDIWSILAWDAIRCAFPENNCSSRIITTTRILEVASYCCPGGDDHIYKMSPLSNRHSERLFLKRIFGSEDCCPDMLKEVSAAILKKCGGLPLAVISISCLLANRPHDKEEWEKVKRSIGSDLNKSQTLEGMKNILSLSYNDLPPVLKTCLLYLSSFPEGYVIERERLVRRWISEGFISEERGQSHMEIAEKYFYELINKSMVEPVDIGYDGKVRACRIHGMMLELIISKCLEENFITVVSGRQTVWEKSQCFIRRLSVQNIDQNLASQLGMKDLSHVRSLTVTGPGCLKHLPDLVKFKSLRVLDFEGCWDLDEYDLNGIENLFQLKYLSCRDLDISEAPSGIAMLNDLETLDLRNTRITDLPAGIVQLAKLQNLLIYDTEDCFDKFIQHLSNGDHDGCFKKFIRQTTRHLKMLGARHGITNQIDDMKVHNNKMRELKSSYKLDYIACSTSAQAAMDPRLSTLVGMDGPRDDPRLDGDIASSTSRHAAVDPRLAAFFAEEAHLVGIDGPRDDLTKWIMEEETKHKHKVLSIVGFGGIGKTTLASEIYHKIQGRFDCHAFVSVSRNPDTKKILKDVISQVSCKGEFTKDIEIWDEKKCIAELRELLQDKRYLLIIDDIWSTLAWNAIKCAFPENNFSSRIIATTRIFEVASSCCPGPDDHIYKMSPLSNHHSERLFLSRIFGSEDCCPDMLKEVSDAILKKCGGLPLAIISISSLLASRPRVKEEWEKVNRSIGSDSNKCQSLEGMNIILSLSYNALPTHLKTCLLYLSLFPEDHVIDKKRLMWRWIAEGFIPEEQGQSSEGVAETYFNELVNQGMFQPVDVGYDGKARACRVHDMILDLIISRSTEENFCTVVSNSQTSWESSRHSIRRLSIHGIDQERASRLANKDLSHVRSLTVTSSSCIRHLPSLVEFESLRALDFEGCLDLSEHYMNGIDKLVQLKYLSFRGTCISELPPGIEMLHDLETLDLRNTYIQELPPGVVQLIKLQRLLLKCFDDKAKIPIGIGNMTNLRELSGFNITVSSVGAVEELGSLINLNVLRVRYTVNYQESHKYKRHEEMLFSSLCKLGSYKLQSVCINGGHSSPFELLDAWSPPPSSLQRFQMSTSYYLSKLPKWIIPLTSLAYLDINLSEVTEEYLRMLGELPALLSLGLYVDKVQKERLPVKGGGFQRLKEFVYGLSEGAMGNLQFEEGALPKLEKLEMHFVALIGKTYGFYLGIEHLRCLKSLEITLSHKDDTYSELKAAAVAIRKEATLHPNHSSLTLGGNIEEYDSDDEQIEVL